MMHDKKVQHGRLSFVLPSRLGQVELVGNIAPADVRARTEKQVESVSVGMRIDHGRKRTVAG